MHNVIGSKEAAAILGVDRNTLNRWAARGDIPIAYKVEGETGSRLFDRKAIEKLARDRKRTTTRDGHPKLDLDVDDDDSVAQPA
jgi:excisionase family DNA binding protein